MDSFDGFVFVTPEYNHGMSGALTNAIDYLFNDWNNKAVGYGGAGGVSAVEQLRMVMGYLRVADVTPQASLSLTVFLDFSVFSPDRRHANELSAMLDELTAWAGALKTLRNDALSISAVAADRPLESIHMSASA